ARFVDVKALLEYLQEEQIHGSLLVRAPEEMGIVLLRGGQLLGAFTRGQPQLEPQPDIVTKLCSDPKTRIEVKAVADLEEPASVSLEEMLATATSIPATVYRTTPAAASPNASALQAARNPHPQVETAPAQAGGAEPEVDWQTLMNQLYQMTDNALQSRAKNVKEMLASTEHNVDALELAIVPGQGAQEVATNQEVRITFDRAMNHDSVERRFVLTPSLAACGGSKPCHFAWNNNTLVFIHDNVSFDLSTTYTVSLHAGYADSSGQTNTLEHSWRFTTEGRPTLASVDPADNASAVAPDRNIVLSFSRPMQPDTLRTAIQLTPDTPFFVRTRPGGDTSQFEIIPLSVLKPDQSYTVSIEGALDTHQNSTYGRIESRFKTGGLSLARRVGYLIGQRGEPAFGVAIVDPHPDSFLNRSTPKILYGLNPEERLSSAILSFDWSPDGRRLVLVLAPRGAGEGRLEIVTLASGQVSSPGASGSEVLWSPDGSSIVYLTHGNLRRYLPLTGQDLAITNEGNVQTS